MTATRSIPDVLEVLDEIFLYLDPESYTDRREIANVRQALLNSALACRMFTEPALNVLWTCLPSDEPILNMLSTLGILRVRKPERNRVGRASVYPTLDLIHDPRTHPRWEDFHKYASRVRAITLYPFTLRPSVWSDIVPVLQEDSGPILPGLRRVIISTMIQEAKDHLLISRLRHVEDKDGRAVLQLMSPAVRQLSMSIPHQAPRSLRDRFREISLEACTMSPRLEHVRVCSLSPVSLQALQNQDHLRSIEINISAFEPAHGLEPLSRLPRLETLSIALSRASPVYLSFNRVRVLVLTGVYLPMEAFLGSARLPQLRSLSIYAPHEDPASLALQCATVLRVLPAKHAHLTELHVKYHKPAVAPHLFPIASRSDSPVEDTRQKPAPMLAGALCAVTEPLLELHELRNVSLHFGVFCFAYSSSDIQRFAEAWPDIETFRLEFTTLEEHRAVFESLVHLANKCPRLRTLHLPEMELTSNAFEGFTYPNRPHPLRELNVARVVFPRGTDLSWEMLQIAERVFPHAGSPVSV